MAKKILVIFFVSILLCSYIIPTTSAFADVVIGDNDSYAVTELGVKNGKRIATMEALLQLLESGVSEINFNDISDLDDYIDDFYDELSNVNYQDVSNEILAGAYNDVKELKKWIDDRGEYIATYYKDYLNSADEGLSNIFNDFQLKLPKSQLVGTSLRGVRGLSRFNSGTPEPEPNPDYMSYINTINYNYGNGRDFFFNTFTIENRGLPYIGVGSQYSWVYYGSVGNTNNIVANTYYTNYMYLSTTIISANIQNVNNEYFVSISNGTPYPYKDGYGYINFRCVGNDNVIHMYPGQNSSTYINSQGYFNVSNRQFASLEDCFKFLLAFRNINIYVDGMPWSIVSDDSPSLPTLDIDGIIKLYGNNNPIQYEFPQGTQIDYNALYTTIYNAIRDNLPLDMQTINNNQVYYDSHDTVYSPTIYNYYGKDGDDENDWIDSILDYATIPDFNSVLGTVAVLDAPFVNGITIVNTGVTDVIPSDILVILGGFFVLVLFVCIINRMSE